MREGPFELKILMISGSTNTGLDNSIINDTIVAPEYDINDLRYAKVEDGKAFAVQVIIHKTSENGFWFKKYHECPPHIRIGLYVDGVDVQYWKRLDVKETTATTMSSIFWGFKDNNNATSGLRSFNFALSKETDEGDSSSNSMSNSCTKANEVQNSVAVGNIRVVLFEAEEVGGIYQNQVKHSEPLPDAPRLLKEGKKFWEQASVTTVAGEQVDLNIEKFVPLTRWRNKSAEPMHSMTMYYHTYSTIRCLGSILSSAATNKRSSSSSTGGGQRRRNANAKRKLVEVDDVAKVSKGDDDTVSLPENECLSDDSDIDDVDVGADFKKTVEVVDLTSTDDVEINEHQIDEDISILVVKKNIPILDLTSG